MCIFGVCQTLIVTDIVLSQLGLLKGLACHCKATFIGQRILTRPITGHDFRFPFIVMFLSKTDVNHVWYEVDPHPAVQEVDQHV